MLGTGSVLQVAYAETRSYLTDATTIPHDDTIPQSNEGYEILTCSITPKSSTSKLLIQVVVPVSEPSNTGDYGCLALFRDSGTDAIACMSMVLYTSLASVPTTLNVQVNSGSTAATTFKVRVGNNAGSISINGDNGARKYGGVQVSSITITEIAA